MTAVRRLLVANRGEIARRVMRTARDMGIATVAVHVGSDDGAPFVSEADEAVAITSYLDADELVAAADRSDADAVHPGYGFLAESAAFARAVQAAGLVWVGPTPETIERMGDKLAAKELAAKADVPVLSSAEDESAFGDLGFPLLVKAVAGGGGKGMRVVDRLEDLADAVASARREALAGFGDDRVFAERYVPRARHVEVQVLGDAHGTVVHLGERECSIQRRHQKIIEESPSPSLAQGRRDEMTAAALRLAGLLDYRSAGTVEFLVDDASGAFFFLEVNTRLQVEHPVTEAVTGLDLVREQLRIAGGEPLGYTQDDVVFDGHAIEARLSAEDPAADFLPSTGTLAAFAPPAEPTVRWDAGVVAGSVVGVDFDPMIAKVISHGPTRSEAIARLALALEHLHVGGVTTNRDLLVSILRTPELASGDTTTDFLERVEVAGRRHLADDELWRSAVAAALWEQGANRDAAEVMATIPSGFLVGRLPPQRVVVEHGDRTVAVHYRRDRTGEFRLGVAGDRGIARVHRWTSHDLDVSLDGRRGRWRVTRTDDEIHLTGPGGGLTLALVPRFELPDVEHIGGGVVAPMPGKVLELRVERGDEVEPGQVVAVLEAMKMEHHLRSATAGAVSEVRVRVGDQVDKDDVLIVVDHGEDLDG